jgi:hypothetical protein
MSEVIVRRSARIAKKNNSYLINPEYYEVGSLFVSKKDKKEKVKEPEVFTSRVPFGPNLPFLESKDRVYFYTSLSCDHCVIFKYKTLEELAKVLNKYFKFFNEEKYTVKQLQKWKYNHFAKFGCSEIFGENRKEVYNEFNEFYVEYRVHGLDAFRRLYRDYKK